jgi:hypothetical protein
MFAQQDAQTMQCRAKANDKAGALALPHSKLHAALRYLQFTRQARLQA